MKSRKIVKKRFIILSIVLSGILYLYISHTTYKYDVELVEDSNSLEAEYTYVFYYDDINNDGVSEHYVFVVDKKENSVAVNFYNILGKELTQINFWNSSHLSQSIYTGDYDEDGIKEIFVTVTRNDSLFLNIFKYGSWDFIVKDKLLFVRENIRKEFPWFMTFFGNLTDVNNDNSLDLLIGIDAYFSLSPRGFLLYDIRNDKLLESFYSKAVFAEILPVDLNGDGTNEILASSTAYDNYRDTTGINDKAGWFVGFNNKLKFIFQPKRYGKEGTQVRFSVTKSKEILLSAFALTDSMDCSLYKMSPSGKVIFEKDFPQKGVGGFFHIEIKGESYIVDVYDHGFIKLYNDKLEIVSKLKTDMPTKRLLFAHDLDRDGVEELFFLNRKDIIITDSELKVVCRIIQPSAETHVQPVLRGEKYSGLSISSNKFNRVYRFTDSFVNNYAPLIVLASIILLYYLLLAINNLAELLLMFLKSYSYFINESNSALLLLNNQGKIITYNKLLENNIIGKKINKNQKLDNYLDSTSDIVGYIKEAIENEINIKRKVVFNDVSDSLLTGEIEITLFKSFWGYTIVYLVKIVDQTEEIINERIQAWSHTAQKLAHEIKTPLGSILLNMKSIKRRLSRVDFENIVEIDDDIKTITEQIDRMKNLTSSFLKITNLEPSSIMVYHPGELIELALEKFSSYISYGVNVIFDESPENLQIYFDKKQFVEVIQILIENAIDAMKGTGTIFIKVKETDNNNCKIIITDTGCGIEKKYLKSIFEPYFTTKIEGTGLGLAFAKKIVDDNRGEIKIDSQFSMGTTVVLTIPSTSK